MRSLPLAIAAIALLVPAVSAQAQTAPGGVGSEVMRSYNGLKDNILKSADKMPAELYSYKPEPDIRIFARILTHVIEAQVRSCGIVNGTPIAEMMKTPVETAPKAEIVAALKASFDACDKAYASITDANALEMLSAGPVKRTRVSLLWGNVSHDNEQYAQIALYMRLKDIKPPSAPEK